MKALSYTHVLIGAIAAFVASAQFFVYAAYVAPRREAAAQLQVLTAALAAEERPAPAAEKSDQKSSATVPELLARVQELALRTGVTVAAIEPQASNPAQFKMMVNGGYGAFLMFFARFEALQVSVTGFEILPPKGDGGSLQITVDFSHTTAPPTVTAKALAGFEARLRSVAMVDPFSPDAGVLAFAPDRDPNDLTWAFHLTSISEIGEVRYATIDGDDYKIGDRLGDAVISAIGADTVTFREADGRGERHLYLRFRDVIADRT